MNQKTLMLQLRAAVMGLEPVAPLVDGGRNQFCVVPVATHIRRPLISLFIPSALIHIPFFTRAMNT